MHSCDRVRQAHELTYTIGHVNTCSHLSKFATWRFMCRGLAIPYCRHLEILGNFWTRSPAFSFCTEPCKLCCLSWDGRYEELRGPWFLRVSLSLVSFILEWPVTKTQYSKNSDHAIQPHHFIANRWGNNANSDRLYFLGLQNHCRWWLQPWN